METIYKIGVIILLTVLVLYSFKYYVNTEGFENGNEEGNNEGLSLEDIQSGASEGAAESSESENNTEEEKDACDPGNWWDNGPVKAIRSKLWGASYNLIYDENGNINSPVSIPINNPNSQSPPGCLTVSDSGWHETAVCVDNNVKQRWKILKISNETEFKAAIDAGKENNGTVGFTYGYKLGDRMDYPFFIIVSAEYPSQALYYNGSAIGVRPIGNYDDQKWDILQNPVKEPITTNEFNYYSKLTPELRTSQSSVNGSLQGNGIAGVQNLAGNQQAMAALLANVMQSPNEGGEFGVKDGLKINLQMDDAMIAQLTGSEVPSNNTAGNNTIEPFTNHIPSYPKKQMDINVTLDYSTAQAPQTSGKKPGIESVAVQQIDAQGNLVTVGKVDVAMKGEDGRTLCDDSLCHPDMRDWASKPYPCRGCVPGEETW